MGGDLIQMLQQYGGARIDPRESGGPGRGGNFDGALGLANDGPPMQLRGGGGGYAQPMRRYDPDFGDPRRMQSGGVLGGGSSGGGGVLGGGATSPFEVGGNSGGGGDPNDPNSYQYMVRHPPSFPMDIGPGSANERAQAAWQKKLEEARLRDSGRPISAGNGYGGAQPPGGGGYGGYGGGVENTPGGMPVPIPHYGDLSWGERMRGREGDPRDMGNGQMAGGMPPWMQRRNPGTRDDMRRGYWDRGMNDQGGMGGRRPLGPESRGGGYWQRPRPMGGQGPMPGQGVPLGSGGHEMPNPGGAPPTTQGGMIKSANPQGQSQVYNPQGGGPVSLTPAQPQQQVRRATRDDNNARGWSGYA